MTDMPNLGDLDVEPEEPEEPADDGEQQRPSAATVLVRMANARYRFGVSEEGETFAVPLAGPCVVRLLRGAGTSLRAQLSRIYFTATGKAPAQQALADALLVLQGTAEEQDPEPLYQRVARHGGALWLDLGDATGRAVRIDARGWSVEDSAPVLFRRTALSAALPEPVAGGDLDELWSWLNVTKEDRPLVAAWLVATLHDKIPHPVLGLFGEQGTGKTTAEKVLATVVDPSPVPARKPPKDSDSWVTAAQGSWVVGLDNLSTMPDWLSDSLCRAVTGDADVRRKLYTDGDLAVFRFHRCLIVTGIDLGALNGDLADRLLTINLDVIDPGARREENELWPRWAEAHPRILGAVLDLAARVEAVRPSVTLARKPRMADFARILAAVDQVLGTAGGQRYEEAQTFAAADALSADPFVSAIAERVSDRFVGTAKELLQLVTPTDDGWRPPKGWPTVPRLATTRLHRQAPVMRKAGWTVVDEGSGNKGNVSRWLIIPPTQTEESRNPSSPASPTSPNRSDQPKRDDQGEVEARLGEVGRGWGEEAGEVGRGRGEEEARLADRRPAAPRDASTSGNAPSGEEARQARQDSGTSQDDGPPARRTCSRCGQRLLLVQPGRDICERCRVAQSQGESEES